MDGAGVRRTEWSGWELVAAGAADGSPTALLLPGAQCTAEFYADVLADDRLVERGARFIAATPPGFGGRQPPPDPGVATYATLTAELIEHVDCDVVVGHSYFANIAIELAMAGTSTRPLVLLSPAFSRRDEEVGLRWLGLASRIPVIGAVPWAAAGTGPGLGDGGPPAAAGPRAPGRRDATQRLAHQPPADAAITSGTWAAPRSGTPSRLDWWRRGCGRGSSEAIVTRSG